MAEIHGTVAPGFEPVREVFAGHFDTAGEVGAALCVRRGDEVLVDLWGGVRDPETGAPWEADTLINVFSVSKGVVALALLVLHDRGELDIDVPLADVWPAFAAHGKDRITLRDVLNHRSGVVAIDRPLSLEQVLAWQPVEDALADQRPLWEPGTDQGYHVHTWGLLLRAAVPRLVGRSVGEILREAVAEPLDADVHLGLDPSLEPRLARLVPAEGPRAVGVLVKGMLTGGLDGRFFRQALLRRRSVTARAVAQPRELGAMHLRNWERPDIRAAELPQGNVHASARGLARAYAPLAVGGEALGVRLLTPQAAAIPRMPQSWAELDRTMRKPMGFSQGFLKEEPGMFSPNPSWHGHPGTGGHLGFADPEAGISFGYTMNRVRPNVRSPTARALCRAVYGCL